MKEQLSLIRQQLASALRQIDALLVAAPSGADAVDPLEYRASPGGMLSEKGVAEMYRRFTAGETDAMIAKAMSVSVQGVQKRRQIWKATAAE